MSNTNDDKFDVFVKNGILSEEESSILAIESQTLPNSNIIFNHNFGSKSVYSFLLDKRKRDYNVTYYTNHRPRLTKRSKNWLLNYTEKKYVEIILHEQELLINCLYESSLISDITYKKIQHKFAERIFYSPFEVLKIASQLTKNEEIYSSLNLEEEIKSLINIGFIDYNMSKKIIEDIKNNKINERIDLIKKYNLGYTVNAKNASSDGHKEISKVLDFLLPKIPFYSSHTINNITFQKGLPWPFQHSCSVDLTFNGINSIFAIENGDAIRLNRQFNFYLIIKIFHFLYEKFESEKEPYFLVNTFLSHYDAYQEYESFTYIELEKNSSKKVNEIWLSPYLTNDYPHFSKKSKVKFLIKLLLLLDNNRLSEKQKEKIFNQVIHSGVESVNEIPVFIDNFMTIVFNDSWNRKNTYQLVFEKLERISNRHFLNFTIQETKLDDIFVQLKVSYQGKVFSKKLYSQGLDYDFCRVIAEIQEHFNLGGKFYRYSLEDLEDGYAIIFLSDAEYENNAAFKILRIFEINTIQNVWLRKIKTHQ